MARESSHRLKFAVLHLGKASKVSGVWNCQICEPHMLNSDVGDAQTTTEPTIVNELAFAY
eukprot:2574742-Amphidinium_carterae.3